MLAPLFYMLPQAREFSLELYEAGIRDIGWNNRTQSLVQGFNDPRWLCMVLMLAREIGDATTEKRLKTLTEREWGPNFFHDEDRFAWTFGLKEEYPRSQLNSLLILSEIGQPGSWSDVYKKDISSRFNEPTVIGVDYPKIGINRAINNIKDRTLYVSTYAATKEYAKQSTRWKVTNLPTTDGITIHLNNDIFKNWGIINKNTIEINTVIETNHFRVSYRGSSKAEASNFLKSNTSKNIQDEFIETNTKSVYSASPPPTCNCC